ncbi:MAG: cbb3-type cytochrome c oxidase N-terminal domain-containing protein [Myxococcaceae bacterium]
MSTNQPPDSKIVHTYDDIQEEDNHLPNWWLFILYATIVFGFGYWLVFHTTKSMPNPVAEYRTDVDALKKSRIDANPMSDEALAALSQDPAQVEEGKKVFASTCASCHAAEGQGLVGPNLTDKFWIHGNKPTDIAKSVTEGYADKGMPPWGPVLGPDKVRKVAAFVLTLKNKNVAGKEPQGNEIND